MKRFMFVVFLLGLFVSSWGFVPSAHAQHQGRLTAGTIRRPGEVHSYKIRGSLGQGLMFIAGSPETSTFDPYIELYDSRNNRLHWNDNSGSGREAALVWPVLWNDTYEIRVSSPAGTTGDYLLIYGSLDLITKQIRRPGAVNKHTFYGEQGQIAIIGTLRPENSNLDPQIALFAPDGTLLNWNDDAGNDLNAAILAPLPQTGYYTVNVAGTNGTTGQYSLIILSAR